MVQASDVTPTDMTTDGDPASRSPHHARAREIHRGRHHPLAKDS